VDQYQESSVNLKYAVKDAKDMEEKLKVQTATLYEPKNIHYTLLTDKEATKINITNKISELSKSSSPRTVLSFLWQVTECCYRINITCSPMTSTDRLIHTA